LANIYRRPDDIRVVMALGDSITAAFLAKGNGWAIPWLGTEEGGWEGRPAAGRKAAERRDTWGHHYAQMPFSTCELIPCLSHLISVDVEEYRGVSYAIGGDPGAVTLPNILGHYSNLTGASIGHRPPVTCGVPGVSRLCSPHHEEDRFNAAVSGSTAAALVAEVQGRCGLATVG
jgi:phospholipase B1